MLKEREMPRFIGIYENKTKKNYPVQIQPSARDMKRMFSPPGQR